MNWRPIETAPKDETDVLLHWDYLKITGMAYWCLERNDWYALDGDTNFYTKPPTHWMPLPPPPSTEPAPQDTGEKLVLKAHSWSDTSLYSEATGKQICTHSIYDEATESTQDELESLQARNMERLRDCWNLLAGHDLSQVVVLDKAVVEKLKSELQYGCSTGDSYTQSICREALASLNV